ncbi:MAG: orotidine-5'-phosphate decarboxylase [Fimbriimonas sp.]
MIRQIICALDTSNRDEAVSTVKKLKGHVGAFKVGHALTLPHGLAVLETLKEAGATRIFLDLKFHDIPNSVALAVREAAKHGVWMMTVHISGGPAMLQAAVEETRNYDEPERPLIVGVSVLTSLDQHILTDCLGVSRTIEEHMVQLSKLAIEYDLDGVVCSPQEVKPIRNAFGHNGIIVTPGIRLTQGDTHDQKRTGDAGQALKDGADYLVVGRALSHSNDVEQTLEQFRAVAA